MDPLRPFAFENTFADELPGLFEPWRATKVASPKLLVFNDELAVELGLDPAALRTEQGAHLLAGSLVQPDSRPLAQAYAGHQFGGYSPRLGDGRAMLLGELVDIGGTRRDLHLKGSGRTPYSRGGDGKAALGPVLREYLMGEAMHALGIPTTRALAVTTTGESVAREEMLPGAVLARVAASHLRVGTFQFAAATGDLDLLQRLCSYALERHYPTADRSERPALALLAAVVESQARLIAQWMSVGFIHGVMNTDNTTISGETIDYGPCAWMDHYDLETKYSSIDHDGRYAFGNQPAIGHWNCYRFAESLLPLIDPDVESAIRHATEVLSSYESLYDRFWTAAMADKIGLAASSDVSTTRRLTTEFLEILAEQRIDFTSAFRSLSHVLRGDAEPLRSLFLDQSRVDRWRESWRTEVISVATGLAGVSGVPEGPDARLVEVADEMDRVNPIYIPRNSKVEEALAAAVDEGDLDPFLLLVEVVGHPYVERTEWADFASPSPPEYSNYRTFCGT